jgi:hypothetical protein
MQRRGATGKMAKKRRALRSKTRKARPAKLFPADLQEQLDNAVRERDDALEQQAAVSQVLQVISSSPGDLEPVFHAMLENATRLCEARYGAMWLREGDAYRAVSLHGPFPLAYIDRWRSRTLFSAGPDTPAGLVAQTRQPAQVLDLRDTRAYLDRDPIVVAGVEVGGIRTMFTMPMLKEDKLVGAISIYRQEVRPFTDKQIELVQNFAAQAVIAIENARLLNELRESLQQQIATADVLKAISSSPGELQPVFETLLDEATRLCAAKFGILYLYDGEAFRNTAMHNVPEALAEVRRRDPIIHPEPGNLLQRVRDAKASIHVEDATKEPPYLNRQPLYVSAVELGGFRSIAGGLGSGLSCSSSTRPRRRRLSAQLDCLQPDPHSKTARGLAQRPPDAQSAAKHKLSAFDDDRDERNDNC